MASELGLAVEKVLAEARVLESTARERHAALAHDSSAGPLFGEATLLGPAKAVATALVQLFAIASALPSDRLQPTAERVKLTAVAFVEAAEACAAPATLSRALEALEASARDLVVVAAAAAAPPPPANDWDPFAATAAVPAAAAAAAKPMTAAAVPSAPAWDPFAAEATTKTPPRPAHSVAVVADTLLAEAPTPPPAAGAAAARPSLTRPRRSSLSNFAARLKPRSASKREARRRLKQHLLDGGVLGVVSEEPDGRETLRAIVADEGSERLWRPSRCSVCEMTIPVAWTRQDFNAHIEECVLQDERTRHTRDASGDPDAVPWDEWFELSRKAWYFGAISRDDAEAILSQCAPHSFLVRKSSIQMAFALSQKDSAGRVCHHLIERRRGGGWVFSNLQSGAVPKVYATVLLLIETAPEVAGRYNAPAARFRCAGTVRGINWVPQE